MTRYLKLGAMAGATGGGALALFLFGVGERPLSEAIAREAAADAVTGHQEMFSRTVQVVGGMVGSVVYGALLGVVVGVVFAAVRHRLPFRDDWRRAVVLALTGFVTLALVPAVKYPANPPSVGDGVSVGRRTALYLILLACSVVASWSAWRLWRTLAARGVHEPRRAGLVASAYAAMIGVAIVGLPPTPDPNTAPAQLVWSFRVASLGGALVFWTVTGLTLGWLLVRREARPDAVRTAAGEAVHV
ncbi:MAG TPA: CbtA family protein [Acidimicrobiales bacterium]|jgi:predicted cobalt transporter CbtA|nr:CbtA family protein [Acidimicrobiales bacterium]